MILPFLGAQCREIIDSFTFCNEGGCFSLNFVDGYIAFYGQTLHIFDSKHSKEFFASYYNLLLSNSMTSKELCKDLDYGSCPCQTVGLARKYLINRISLFGGNTYIFI